MNDDFKELQTLLRLKQYEQPPQGFDSYSEHFLKEFHRRQRHENARKTGFARWQEMVGEWMDSFTVPRYAYAATLAVFGAVALGVTGFNPSHSSAPVASATLPVSSAATASSPEAASTFVSAAPALALNSQLDLSDLEVQSKMDTVSHASDSQIQPRYILDARPVSYNAGFSF